MVSSKQDKKNFENNKIKQFPQLKLHTEYSLLEGVGKIEEYIKRAKEINSDILAITDTSMFGVIEFYKKCKKNNIKPIIGLEVYLDGIVTEGEFSLTLLAKDKAGYENLSKLSSLSYSRFHRKRNKIKYEELVEYSNGLFVLSGGIYSEVVRGLIEYKYPEVKRVIQKFVKDFGESFVIEIPAIKRLENVRKSLVEILSELENVRYIITNDVYYPNNGDAILQKIMTSIKEGNKLESEHKEILYDDLYMKSYAQIEEIFANFINDGLKNNELKSEELKNEDLRNDELKNNELKSEESKNTELNGNVPIDNISDDIPISSQKTNFFQKGMENLREIINKCNVEFEFDKFKFPKYDLPDGITEKEYLRNLVFEGIHKKYEGALLTEEVLERVEYELNIVDKMGYNGYFIIVWDFVKFAKEKEIYVGPGRGSAAGSIISYALNITEIDPIKYNLIFERFLNPERISMPDIDIDFDQEQREIVIDYVFKKYGKEHVAHIITFGTLKARAAIRDIGRILNVDLRKVDKVTKLIPFNMDLTEALTSIQSLKEMYKTDEEVKKMIDFSLRIEGRVRHASVHAAGIVISKEELDKEIPLYSDGRTNIVSTQYQMKELEDLGILKIDFLGLKNLTVLRKTIENIKTTCNKEINLKDIPLDDKKTYKLMTSADTLGVFQCESTGIRRLMKKVKIEKFEDIVALLALYRPGPLLSGMVDDFIAAKNTEVSIKYPDDSLKEILEETYGVILYQEQVMNIVSKMANYTLGEADELRRAIGKKIPEIIEQNRVKFVEKAVNNGTNREKANEIYDLIDKFGGYGFNKSHSAAYALVSYWTAYFKANYPTEFFAAIMTTEMYNIDRLSVFINEAREKGIKILVPDINLSSYEFVVEKISDEKEELAIRFGMTAIKGIGVNFVTEIIEERQNTDRQNIDRQNINKSQTPEEKINSLMSYFISYEDFVYRMKQRGLNKKQLESLILSGCLDNFSGNRKEKFMSIDKVMEWAQKKYEAEEDLQLILFGGKSEKIGDFHLEKQEEYSQAILLKNEKEYLGIYVSNHPLNAKKKLLEILEHNKISELLDWRNRKSKKIRLVGIIKDVNKIVTKSSGEPMAKFYLEDFTGEIEIICFPRDYIDLGYKIYEDGIAIIEGNINQDGNKYSIVLSSITNVDELEENRFLKLYVLIDNESKEKVSELKNIIIRHKGNNSVFLAMDTSEKHEIIKLSQKYNVKLSKYFMKDLIKLVGLKKIKLR